MSGDPIDREVLALLDFGEPPGQVLATLLRVFLEHAPARVAALAAAGSAGDPAGVEAAAHALKSSVRQYGGSALGDRLEALERAAAAGTVDAAEVAAAVADFEHVRAALAAVHADLARSAQR